MRPWSLDPEDVTPLNPLLTDLRITAVPAVSAGACSQAPDAAAPPKKRLRKNKEPDANSAEAEPPGERRCYTLALEEYLQKGVV